MVAVEKAEAKLAVELLLEDGVESRRRRDPGDGSCATY